MIDLFGKTQRVKEMCQRLAPFIGEKANDIFEAYILEDMTGKDQIESYLEAALARYIGNSLDSSDLPLVPPSVEQVKGSYEIAPVIYGKKQTAMLGLREKEWIQHVGIFGRTGAGKTNLGFLVVEQLVKHEKPILIFDWKRNYRDLLSKPGFEDAEVYTIGRDIAPFTFNPLIPPPGTNPKTWLKKLNEVIAHAYLLGNGVLYLLQQTLDTVYREWGVYDGTVTKWPTIQDVLNKAQEINAKGREAGWLSSTLRALASLCFGDMGDLVNQQSGLSPAALLDKPVILELDALTQQDKTFFIESFLLWIHHWRMQESDREMFKHAVMIEEAHHILANERRSLVGGQSVMEITFREIREFGEGLILLDQHPSQISLPALGNTYTTFCLNLKHSKDVNAMASAMLLDGKEKDILGSLEVGQAVVKLQGRVAKPFMIHIPEYIIQKGRVTDEMIRRRMKPRTQTVEITRKSIAPGPTSPESVPTTALSNGQTRCPLAEEQQRSLETGFLQDVQTHPDSGIAARYKRLGISVRQGQKIKAYLASGGLIEEEETRTPTGRLRVIRLTDKGKQFLNAV